MTWRIPTMRGLLDPLRRTAELLNQAADAKEAAALQQVRMLAEAWSGKKLADLTAAVPPTAETRETTNG